VKKFIKKIPGMAWLADIIHSILIIVKYTINLNADLQSERANPKDPEWNNNPWAIVFQKRSNYAKKFSKDKVVLDLCCGTGWTTYEISGICKTVIGVDYSEDTIIKAEMEYKNNNLSFHKMNALSLKFKEEYFDTVISMEAIEHFTEQDGEIFIKEAHRVLKKGGVFVGSTPETENRNPIKLLALKKIDPYHLFLYSKSILYESLRKYFSNVEINSQPEGWMLFIAEK